MKHNIRTGSEGNELNKKKTTTGSINVLILDMKI